MFSKIEIKHHLFLFCISTTLWTFYWLGGLSSEYYQTWSFIKTLFIVDVIPGIALIPIGYYFFKFIIGHDFLIASFWAAFYGSFPLAVYDYLYIAVHLNEGLVSYITNYWYLSSFHLVPWFVFPLVAKYIIKQHA